MTNERATVAYPVTVTDIAGIPEGEYTLDKTGFELRRHVSRTSCLADGYRDEAAVRAEYLPECERLLGHLTGATKVAVFDHKVRRGPTDWHKLGPGNSSKRGPLHRVHVDQSYDGAEIILRRYLPADEAEAVLASKSRRWQIINVCRQTVHLNPSHAPSYFRHVAWHLYARVKRHA